MSGDARKASSALSASPEPLPTVRGEELRVVYRGKTVLDVDSIALPAGQTFVLLGASGAGKSTLLRILGLLEKPTAGRVFFDGRPANRGDLGTRRTISAVFQKPYLLRGTIADNVGYGLRLRGVPAAERIRRAADALERVGLAGWESRSALTLSGGEAQRVALARALVLKPRLLLLDEPLSYLDPMLKRQLSLEFARILADEAVTTLYVTHDQDEAAVVADRIGVMREGRMVAEGDPETVLALPSDPWVAAFLRHGDTDRGHDRVRRGRRRTNQLRRHRGLRGQRLDFGYRGSGGGSSGRRAALRAGCAPAKDLGPQSLGRSRSRDLAFGSDSEGGPRPGWAEDLVIGLALFCCVARPRARCSGCRSVQSNGRASLAEDEYLVRRSECFSIRPRTGTYALCRRRRRSNNLRVRSTYQRLTLMDAGPTG